MITRFFIERSHTACPLLKKSHAAKRRFLLMISVVICIFTFELAVAAEGVNRSGTSAEKSPTLGDAISKVGTKKTTLLISQRFHVGTDLSVPSNVRIKLTRGGKIYIAEGKTVTMTGPFDAPLEKVFDGTGRVKFTPTSTTTAYPEWWGAANGRESSIAIQSAIDSLTKGDVLLSGKIYLLSRRVTMRLIGSGDKVSAMLVPRSGVNIIGRGHKSVLKVVDNHTLAGDYVVFAPANAEKTSDIIFRNFRIDGNGAHNLVKGNVRRAMAIWLYAGKNIMIDRVWFENQPGRNVIKLGSDSLSYLISDSVISNCTFSNVGGAIPGNRGQGDHSTLYISGENVTVKNNRLSNPGPYNENGPPVAVVAGIEIHGDDMLVSGNHVENYGKGGYIVADGIVTAKNHRWTGNNFINMTKMGISIWSLSEVKNVVIERNHISLNGELDQGVAGVYQPLSPPDTTVGIDGITVRSNRIDSTAAKPGTVWCGIIFTAVKNAMIEKNAIDKVSGAAVLIIGNTRKPLDCRNIVIRDNYLSDTSFNRYRAYPYAITVTNDGQGRFEGIEVTGNSIENKTPLGENMGGIGITGKGSVTRVRIDGRNRFINLKQRNRQIHFSGHEKNVFMGPEQN